MILFMYLCFLQIFYAAVEMHGHSTSICFHLQLALETRVRRLKKPHHDIDNGVRFLAYALLVAGGQRMRVTPQVLITHI
jgi:hypothetical protein